MDLEELLKTMERLRGENGCPWNRQQTRESLKPFIIEEAYELIESIEGGNPESIKEELGDLLLQIVFQCQIAKEKNEFEMSDVIESICKKLIARHPHVFGKSECKTWRGEDKLRGSILEGVPKALPSLLRAYRLQEKAAEVGFDWEMIEDVLKKLDEELKEFRKALKTKKQDEIEDELGDILFMLVSVSRFIGVNPEDALRKAINRFISRFLYIEMSAKRQGRRLSDMTIEEMDRLWDEAKSKHV